MATTRPLPRINVRPAAHAVPVRTLSVVVPRVTRVRPLVVVPAPEAPQLLRPVLAPDGLRRALGVISSHGPIFSLWPISDSVLLRLALANAVPARQCLNPPSSWRSCSAKCHRFGGNGVEVSVASCSYRLRPLG